jgi:hypothetical protein
MVNYPFKSFERHFDYGFGGYADAFKRAADELVAKKKDGDIFLNMHLPINYLYRHSIELYLKSFITILHKRLRLPFGPHNFDSTPYIFINKEWIPIYRVHSISDLYAYYKIILTKQRSEIIALANTDWTDLPLEFDSQIAIIGYHDEKSTFLRYPALENRNYEKEKSSFQESTIPELFQRLAPGNEYTKAFISVDESDNIVDVYQLENEPLEQLTNALSTVALLFEGAHLGMRIELADGE